MPNFHEESCTIYIEHAVGGITAYRDRVAVTFYFVTLGTILVYILSTYSNFIKDYGLVENGKLRKISHKIHKIFISTADRGVMLVSIPILPAHIQPLTTLSNVHRLIDTQIYLLVMTVILLLHQ